MPKFELVEAVLDYISHNGKVYFFSGDEYVRYDVKKDKVDSGYPKRTRDHWHGVPFNRIDAALDYRSHNGKVYFFSGDEYVRYDVKKGKVDSGYPKRTVECWYGMPGYQGIYLSEDQVIKIIRKRLAGKLKSNCNIILGDARYFCPSLSYAQKIINDTSVDQHKWIEERFDCDDFAFLLKAGFVKDAYNGGKRRAAHCFGIVWGSLPGPHAINWMINDDMKLRFVEPQNDQIFFPRTTDKDIYFMMS